MTNPWDYTEIRRNNIEYGPGGDHDRPYVYVDPTRRLPPDRIRVLVRLMVKVLAGKLGGANDGE
jgi:hypothetical protein